MRWIAVIAPSAAGGERAVQRALAPVADASIAEGSRAGVLHGGCRRVGRHRSRTHPDRAHGG